MNDKLSLTELQLIIKDSLYMSFPGMYWVVAEISELNENFAGHCYIELIEKNSTENNISARIRAVIWSKKYSFLKSLFKNATGESLKEGFKVLLRVTVEYHEIYGLSLVVNDIDPAFTIGEMAVRRQQIIKRLEQEGLFSMNKELGFPTVPRRIAVISSKSAAGYSDFLKHLENNSYGYSFHTFLFEASMQGSETERSVVDALDRISEDNDSFDIVVIIRGGGSQTDLSWFDNYNIAFHITQFPLPVLTGIGHEKDITVADMVAYQSVKTPTAAADFIITTVHDTENHLSEMAIAISELSQSVLKSTNTLLDNVCLKLINLSELNIGEEKKKLTSVIFKMAGMGKEYLIRQEIIPANLRSRLIFDVKTYSLEKKHKLTKFITDLINYSQKLINHSSNYVETLDTDLAILNPDNVLRRGYSMTSMNGQIIRNPETVKKGDNIKTRLYGGTIKSKVIE
jgi:exodeoxyribonuclease VII large subunit